MNSTAHRRISKQLARAGTACVLAVGACALAAGSAHGATTVMPACPAAVVSGPTATVTCVHTGAAQYWTVPAGVSQAAFTLYGAAGGAYSGDAPGGSGAEVTGTLLVTPGTVLQVNVGNVGGGPGDGGGASDIRDDAATLADRLLVAGGGGGGGLDGLGYCNGEEGGCIVPGGAGGDAGSPGGTGASGEGTCNETLSGADGGGAGTATIGGAGGASNLSNGTCGGPTSPPNGAAGSEGNGGAAGDSLGGYGGGGGGGYYGGGGGGGNAWDSDNNNEAGAGGGGGGSSYTGTATDASVNDDPASPPAGGSGEVIITYHPVLSVTSHSLSGQETAVSCLIASRCVAVGSHGRRAVVVTLTGGAQSHAAVLSGSSVISSVSCPSKSGCWAIGHPARGAGAYLVRISSAGRPAAERTLAVPAGTTLGVISCASMTSCQVAGADNRLRPAAVETGTWNGSKLHLHRVPVAGSTQVSVAGISCWHSHCAAVGSAVAGTGPSDLILTTSGGKPGMLNTDSGYALSSISCVSATTCYAAGAAVLVTVTSGVPADAQAVAGGWNGNAIECSGSHCEAAGGEVLGAAYADVLVSLTGGTAGSPVIVQAGLGYSGIAARGISGFIAIGAASSSGSEDTVG